jgi:hypothetical protein
VAKPSLFREGQLQPGCQRRRPRPLKSGSHLDPPVLINIMLLGLIASSMDDTMHNACSSVWLAKIHRQPATPVLALPWTARQSTVVGIHLLGADTYPCSGGSSALRTLS